MADNPIGSTNNPTEVMQTQEVVVNPAIYPNVIVTDSYLDDRITFNIDERFGERSIVKINDSISEALRDFTGYVVVDPNVTGSVYYRVTMESKLYDRNRMFEKIDRTFTEFI